MNLERAHEINKKMYALALRKVAVMADVDIESLRGVSLEEMIEARRLVDGENHRNTVNGDPTRYCVVADLDMAALFAFIHGPVSNEDNARPLFQHEDKALMLLELVPEGEDEDDAD